MQSCAEACSTADRINIHLAQRALIDATLMIRIAHTCALCFQRGSGAATTSALPSCSRAEVLQDSDKSKLRATHQLPPTRLFSSPANWAGCWWWSVPSCCPRRTRGYRPINTAHAWASSRPVDESLRPGTTLAYHRARDLPVCLRCRSAGVIEGSTPSGAGHLHGSSKQRSRGFSAIRTDNDESSIESKKTGAMHAPPTATHAESACSCRGHD